MASDYSGIEWTEATWNPISGCTKVSPGCDRCYAEAITRRFPQTFPNGFALTLRPNALDIPLQWRRPRMVFVNSMSDLFHADVPESYLIDVFDVMQRAAHHTFQILTKRAERLARVAPRLQWSSNVWIGVSVESALYAWRIDYLRKVPAAVRFVSAEPLLSSLPRTNLSGIDWLIAGGESQPGCRQADLNWFRDLRDQCRASNVAFFLKQLGGHPCKRGGDEAVLDGRRWVQFPRPRPVVPLMLPSSTDAMRSEGRVQHLSDYRRQNRVGKEDTRSSSAAPAGRRPHQRKRIAGDC